LTWYVGFLLKNIYMEVERDTIIQKCWSWLTSSCFEGEVVVDLIDLIEFVRLYCITFAPLLALVVLFRAFVRGVRWLWEMRCRGRVSLMCFWGVFISLAWWRVWRLWENSIRSGLGKPIWSKAAEAPGVRLGVSRLATTCRNSWCSPSRFHKASNRHSISVYECQRKLCWLTIFWHKTTQMTMTLCTKRNNCFNY